MLSVLASVALTSSFVRRLRLSAIRPTSRATRSTTTRSTMYCMLPNRIHWCERGFAATGRCRSHWTRRPSSTVRFCNALQAHHSRLIWPAGPFCRRRCCQTCTFASAARRSRHGFWSFVRLPGPISAPSLERPSCSSALLQSAQQHQAPASQQRRAGDPVH